MLYEIHHLINRAKPAWMAKFDENFQMAKRHVQFCSELYKHQSKCNRYFLHARPWLARSWQHSAMINASLIPLRSNRRLATRREDAQGETRGGMMFSSHQAVSTLTFQYIWFRQFAMLWHMGSPAQRYELGLSAKPNVLLRIGMPSCLLIQGNVAASTFWKLPDHSV